MRLADIKKYLNTLLASFSSVLDLELTILQADPLERIAATGSWYATDVVCYENGRLVPAWQNSYTLYSHHLQDRSQSNPQSLFHHLLPGYLYRA